MLLRLASDGLSAGADGCGCAGEAVHWDWDVLAVADLLELDVGDLLVVNEGGVVEGHESGEFGEVGCHSSCWILLGDVRAAAARPIE